jgi:small neutral amino acid transporter SnatA (MarC family)
LHALFGTYPRFWDESGSKCGSIPRKDGVQQRTTVTMFELTAKREYVESYQGALAPIALATWIARSTMTSITARRDTMSSSLPVVLAAVLASCYVVLLVSSRLIGAGRLHSDTNLR